MPYHTIPRNALLTVGLTTHFTLIPLLTTICVLMIHQTAVLIEGFLTYTIIHQYVCVDVLSDSSVD